MGKQIPAHNILAVDPVLNSHDSLCRRDHRYAVATGVADHIESQSCQQWWHTPACFKGLECVLVSIAVHVVSAETAACMLMQSKCLTLHTWIC